MNGIQVTFLDQTGAKRIKAMISPTVQVKAMIQTIITKMSLPATAPDGTPMSYSLDHKEGGKRLLEEDTLPGAGVKEGDHLLVYPEIVAGIDTMEYQRLIQTLDQDIERARLDFEAKERRERVEQRKKLLLHWKEGLTKRKAELEKYGGMPSVDLQAKLGEIERELEQMDLEQERAAVAPPAGPATLSEELSAAVMQLIGEVNNAAPTMEDLPYEERAAYLQYWAAVWRGFTIQAGEAVVAQAKVFRWSFAAIAHLRDAVTPALRLDGLSQSSSKDPFVWNAAKERLVEEITRLGQERTQREAQEKAVQDAIDELRTFLGAVTPTSEDDVRTFRHLTRKAASYPNAREEVAFLCQRYRETLGPEFQFLWKDEKPEPEAEPSKKFTRAQIVQRLCRRLKAKAMIGACHAPWDMVIHGFPSHDYGRAEEALDVLSKVGLIRRRRTGIGVRVSIEPKAMPDIDMLIGGVEDSPVLSPALVAWMKEE